jgi:hypothetical protein
MVLVIIGSLVTACFLLSQSVHILKNGDMRPFFEQPGNLRASVPCMKRGARFAATILYAVPGIAIICILMLAVLKNDRFRLFDWLADHVIGLAGGVFLLTFGLISILRSDIVVRWVGSAYPDYDLGERNPSVLRFVRGLGAFISAFGLFVLKRM